MEEEKNSFPPAFLSPFTFTSEVIGQVSTTRRFTRPWWDGKPTENYSKGRRLFEIILARYFDGAGAKLVAALLTTLRYNRARGGGREGGREAVPIPSSGPTFLRTYGARVIGERANRNGRYS